VVLLRRRFFLGAHIWDSSLKDLAWFRPDGSEMTQGDWEKPYVRCLMFLLGGDAILSLDERGNRIVGDTLLCLMNADFEPTRFTLPALEWGADWEIAVDTARGHVGKGPSTAAGGTIEVVGRSLMVLRHPPKL
jgi:glycogen operon protein